jgi:hypothetical protein
MMNDTTRPFARLHLPDLIRRSPRGTFDALPRYRLAPNTNRCSGMGGFAARPPGNEDWRRPERPALVWRGDTLLAFDAEQVRRYTAAHPLKHDR